jgi:hypothetical protein
MMPRGSLVLRVPVPQFADYMQSVFLIEDQPSPWSWSLLTNSDGSDMCSTRALPDARFRSKENSSNFY